MVSCLISLALATPRSTLHLNNNQSKIVNKNCVPISIHNREDTSDKLLHNDLTI